MLHRNVSLSNIVTANGIRSGFPAVDVLNVPSAGENRLKRLDADVRTFREFFLETRSRHVADKRFHPAGHRTTAHTVRSDGTADGTNETGREKIA